MSYAVVKSGGADGRYTIQLDYGSAQRDFLLFNYNQLVNELNVKIDQTDALILQTEAKLVPVQLELDLALADYAAALQAGDGSQTHLLVKFYLDRLAALKVAFEPIKRQKRQLEFDRKAARQQIQALNTFQVTETKGAWCTTLTEDIPGEKLVETIDIPGDPSLVLIAPDGAGWKGKGHFQAREVLSPAQTYYNAAMFPGWQKFRPTYRWGTAGFIDYENDVMNVDLAPALSSAQRIDVNQRTNLAGVPVKYMTCNAAAFEKGDRVIVEFQGQDFDNPRVIGFLDNPKECPVEWPDVYVGHDYFAPAVNVTPPDTPTMNAGVRVVENDPGSACDGVAYWSPLHSSLWYDVARTNNHTVTAVVSKPFFLYASFFPNIGEYSINAGGAPASHAWADANARIGIFFSDGSQDGNPFIGTFPGGLPAKYVVVNPVSGDVFSAQRSMSQTSRPGNAVNRIVPGTEDDFPPSYYCDISPGATKYYWVGQPVNTPTPDRCQLDSAPSYLGHKNIIRDAITISVTRGTKTKAYELVEITSGSTTPLEPSQMPPGLNIGTNVNGKIFLRELLIFRAVT